MSGIKIPTVSLKNVLFDFSWSKQIRQYTGSLPVTSSPTSQEPEISRIFKSWRHANSVRLSNEVRVIDRFVETFGTTEFEK